MNKPEPCDVEAVAKYAEGLNTAVKYRLAQAHRMIRLFGATAEPYTEGATCCGS
jgi:hypothetical protein